jgi:hypothetical protein
MGRHGQADLVIVNTGQHDAAEGHSLLKKYRCAM